MPRGNASCSFCGGKVQFTDENGLYHMRIDVVLVFLLLLPSFWSRVYLFFDGNTAYVGQRRVQVPLFFILEWCLVYMRVCV